MTSPLQESVESAPQAPGAGPSPELLSILKLAAPLAAVNAGNQLMSVVDTGIVGRLGEVAQGGVGLANALFMAFTLFGMGVMVSLDPLISQALGAGQDRRARTLLWQGVWLAIGVGAAISLPAALSPVILGPFGIDAATAAVVRRYLLYRLPGLIPFLCFIGLRSYLQALGISRPLVISMLLGNLLNLGAAVLLVFGGAGLPSWTGPLRAVPAMGVIGAALATTACIILQLLVVVVALRRLLAERGGTAPSGAAERMAEPAAWRPRPKDLWQALGLGIPIGLHFAAEVGIFSLVGLMAGRLGPRDLAAHNIALTLASFSYNMALGVSVAGSVGVGRAVGAGDAAATRRAGLAAFLLGLGLMALWALIFFCAAGHLAALLSSSPEVIRATTPLLAVAAIFQISDGAQAVGAGVLRGAGDTRFPFLANAAGHYLVGLPVAIFLGFYLKQGIFGLWWGLFAGLTAVAVALFLRFLRLSGRPIAPIDAS